MSVSSRRWQPFVAAFLLSFSVPVIGQLRFEPVSVNSNIVRLALLGASGEYAIESSTDLSNWTPAFRGPMENGRLEIEMDVTGLTKTFYRARRESGTQPIEVTNTYETNFTVGTFATIDGLTRTLYGPDGIEFTLRVPTNTVSEGLPVSMTLITNMSGVPFSGALLGAVRIEFDSERLIGAAMLTMSLDTNVDRRKVISFFTELDGSELMVTPDRVGTNIVIPITQAGIYGAALGTTQDVASVLATLNTNVVDDADIQGATGQSFHAQSIIGTTRLCYPQAYARAIAVRSRLSRLRRQFQAELAAQLTTARQQQLSGETADADGALTGAGLRACEFYNRNIERYWAEAANNCALMSILMEMAVPLDRQLQLLGVPDGERCTENIFSAERLCPAFKGCLQEIKLCCSSGHASRARLIDIVTLSREQALLGLSGNKALGCWDLGDDKAEEAMDVCTPRSWSGSLKVKEKGDSYEHTLSVNGFQEITKTFSLNYSGFIDEASEINLGHLGVQADLRFDGSLVVHDYSDDTSVYWVKCGKGVNSFTSDASANDSGYFVMNLNIQTNGSYGLVLGFAGKNKDHEPFTGDELDVTIGTIGAGIGCSPPMRRTMDSRRSTTFFSAPGTFYNGTSGNMNRIEGKMTVPNTHGDGLETTVEFEWHLTRKVRQ